MSDELERLRLAAREVLDAQAAMINAAVVDDDFPAERNRFNAAMTALGRLLDEAEGDAPHEGCFDRACDCVQDELMYWRNIAQTLAPEHPIVNLPVATLESLTAVVEAADELMERPGAGSEMRLRVALNVWRRTRRT